MNTHPIIGITERGDAGVDFSWTEKINSTDYSVIITKNTTTARFHEEAIRHKDKMLLHATITGWGTSPMEPNVPAPLDSIESVVNLIKEGFPSEQVVWRIDPIIPTVLNGIEKAEQVFDLIEAFQPLHNVLRIRTSVFDAYPHSIRRIETAGYTLSSTAFTADNTSFAKINNMIACWKAKGYSIEACAEPRLNATHIGCVNQKDANLFGLDLSNFALNGQNRRGCLCSTAKTELLSHRQQCPHKCAYCYWK